MKLTFYEKPGCINNRKQKALLLSWGLTLDVRNLLETPWREEDLRRYFQGLPVSDWFNASAPRVKNGEINPATISAASALKRMVEDRLLIRRPLLAGNGVYMAGFDVDRIRAQWLLEGDAIEQPQEDLEHCPRTDKTEKEHV